MFVISKQSLVMNCVTYRFDFIPQSLLYFELDIKSVTSVVATKIRVLNGSGILIVISHLPLSFMSLIFLISGIVELDFLAWYYEFVSLVTSLWLRSQQAQNRDTTASPLRNSLSKVFDGDCHGCSILL